MSRSCRSSRFWAVKPSSQQRSTRDPSSRGGCVALHTSFTERRESVCRGLEQLAAAWRTIDVIDELGWAAYASDFAGDLALYLAEHSARAHAAARMAEPFVNSRRASTEANGAADELLASLLAVADAFGVDDASSIPSGALDSVRSGTASGTGANARASGSPGVRRAV